jgi:hypothetical protein
MERERFDGADVAHLLRSSAAGLDWERLLARFAGHEPVLLAHLILFRYIFPDSRDNVPQPVIERLQQIAVDDRPAIEDLCRGTLISRAQYLIDIGERGLRDARMPPIGRMKPEDIAHWTAAIGTIR